MRLWDGDINLDYCRDCRRSAGGERCKPCPEPAVLPDAVPLVAGYLLCATQWRTGMCGRTGLDYTACRVAIDAHRPSMPGLPPDAELWEGLQLLEYAFLQADFEQRERDRLEREAAAAAPKK